jgi:hypothetical protein
MQCFIGGKYETTVNYMDKNNRAAGYAAGEYYHGFGLASDEFGEDCKPHRVVCPPLVWPPNLHNYLERICDGRDELDPASDNFHRMTLFEGDLAPFYFVDEPPRHYTEECGKTPEGEFLDTYNCYAFRITDGHKDLFLIFENILEKSAEKSYELDFKAFNISNAIF